MGDCSRTCWLHCGDDSHSRSNRQTEYEYLEIKYHDRNIVERYERETSLARQKSNKARQSDRRTGEGDSQPRSKDNSD